MKGSTLEAVADGCAAGTLDHELQAIDDVVAMEKGSVLLGLRGVPVGDMPNESSKGSDVTAGR